MALGRTNINLPEIPIKPKAVYLYKEGDECTDISGGWSTKYGNAAGSTSGSGITGNPTRTKEEDHLLVSVPDQTYAYASDHNMVGTWFTNNKINLTDFDKLVFDVEVTFGAGLVGGTPYASMFFQVSTTTYTSNQVAQFNSKSTAYGQNGERTLIELDVSSLSGEYYIIMGVSRYLDHVTSADDSVKLKAYDVYLL